MAGSCPDNSRSVFTPGARRSLRCCNYLPQAGCNAAFGVKTLRPEGDKLVSLNNRMILKKLVNTSMVSRLITLNLMKYPG